jgi:long-chain fatty acid transport protein
MQKHATKQLLQLSIAALFLGSCGSAFASGFQLFEANGLGTGDYYASAVAGAFDASTASFNPAGLMLIPNQQIVLSAVSIFSNIHFQGSDTWTNPTATNGISTQFNTALAPSYSQSGSVQGGGYALVPGFDYVAPINNSMAFGFSVGVPFGLQTSYSDSSFLRYAATQTSIQVIDISPSLAFQFTDHLSFGIGPDAEYVTATLNSIAGLPNWAQSQNLPANSYDTQSENNATGWGYGWHTGLMYEFTPDTRVGLAYHSKVSVEVNGTSKFQGPLAGGPGTLINPVSSQFTNTNLSANTTLPATTMFGFYHAFNPMWSVDAMAAYTQWNVFNSLNLENVAAVNSILGPDAIEVIVPQGFHNSWRFAGGVNYQPCQQWIIRAGLGYDQSPTDDQYRNVRLPDGNRFATAIGVHYQYNKQLGVDLGWTHLFFQNGDVNVVNTLGSQVSTTVGTAESYANLVGVQLTWNIV